MELANRQLDQIYFSLSLCFFFKPYAPERSFTQEKEGETMAERQSFREIHFVL